MLNSLDLITETKQGRAFVISAPAGAGKTTLAQMLTQEFANVLPSISLTTRARRGQEVEGKDYFFVSQKRFDEAASNGELLEHVRLFEHCYGTPKSHIHELTKAGKHVLLVIDTQGALDLMKRQNTLPFPLTFIFVSPPSLKELQMRLRARNQDSEEQINKRLDKASQEMSLAGHYDYHVINDKLERAYTILRSIVIAESHRVWPQALSHPSKKG